MILKMFHVNVFGMMHCTRLVLPHMLARKEGHIVNIGSQAGKVATPKTSVYAASKHAVIGFSNSLRMELQPDHVYVTTVNPGPVKTKFLDDADMTKQYANKVARWALTPETVANHVLRHLFTPKREINLPVSMAIGSWLYQVAPAIVETLGAPFFHKK